MEYYSAVKTWKNAATWIQLEMITLNDVRKRKTNTIWYHLYVESKIWHKWTYQWNRNRITKRRVAAGGGGWEQDGVRGRGYQVQASICGMGKQGPTAQHRELYLISCDKPQWKRIFKMCVYTYTHTRNWVTLLHSRHTLTQHCKSTILQ